MTEIVDVRKVVAKMRLLASNAENRPFIAKDKGCLRGLLAFLDNAWYPSQLQLKLSDKS